MMFHGLQWGSIGERGSIVSSPSYGTSHETAADPITRVTRVTEHDSWCGWLRENRLEDIPIDMLIYPHDIDINI